MKPNIVFPVNISLDGNPEMEVNITIRIQIPQEKVRFINFGVSNENGSYWVPFHIDLPLHHHISGIYTIHAVKHVDGVIYSANKTGILNLRIDGE